MGGPRTTPQQRDKIVEAYLTLLDAGTEPVAKQVRLRAITLCTDARIQVRPFPTLRTVQDIIQNIKDSSRAKTKHPGHLDNPWSMGSLGQLPITESSIPILLKVWKATVALSQPFTNRDAIWAARLGTFITDINLLCYWVSLFSLRERVAESLGQDFNSASLDSYLVTDSTWDMPVADISDDEVQQEPPFGHPHPRTLRLGAENVDALAAQIERSQFTTNLRDVTERDVKLLYAIQDLPSLTELGLTEASMWVYIRWLKRLFAGPTWPKKRPNDAIRLIQRLREWVKTHPNNQQDDVEQHRSSDRGAHVIQGLSGDPFPSNILAEVGYKAKSNWEEPK